MAESIKQCEIEGPRKLAHDHPHNVASRLINEDRFLPAVEVLTEYLRSNPDCVASFLLLAVVSCKLGNLEQAEALCLKAQDIAPGNSEVLVNLGVVQSMRGDRSSALVSFELALSLDPQYPEAHKNLAAAYYEFGELEKADHHFQIFFKMRPDDADALHNWAVLLKDLGRTDEAVKYLRRTLDLAISQENAKGSYFSALSGLAKWDELSALRKDIGEEIKSEFAQVPPFIFLSIIDDLRLQLLNSKAWFRRKYMRTCNRPAHGNTTGRLRIGYFSADYRNHPAMHLMIEMFEKHDRNQFEVFAYSFGSRGEDIWAERARQAFEHFIDAGSMSDEEVIRDVHSNALDIAIDLMGYTKHHRMGIFATGLAPVQANYMGFPGTLGTHCHDYIIADPVLIPEPSRGYYTEKVAYQPESYMANCQHREIAKLPSKAELGLPETGTIFCCFNQTYKITPEVFDGWMNILTGVPNSVLWLWVSNQIARENLKKEASARGVDPGRLIFADTLPVDQHLGRLPHADLFLDTRPYNAHTTASDALRMGVPVLTRIGEAFASRVAASLLTAVGLTELITQSEEEYVAKAIELGRSAAHMQSLKDKLRANLKTSSLFDSERFTRNMERLYLEMHRRALAGEAPDHIFL